MQHKYFFFSRQNLRTWKAMSTIAMTAVCMSIAFGVGIQTAGELRETVLGPTTKADDTRIAGDINNDNFVDTLDVELILETAKGYREPTSDELAGDPNGDLHLTIDDALAVLRSISTR
jgi:Dockerin type I domain